MGRPAIYTCPEKCRDPNCVDAGVAAGLCRYHYKQRWYDVHGGDQRKKTMVRYWKKLPQIKAQVRRYLSTVQGRYVQSRSASRRRGIRWLLTIEEFTNLSKHPCTYCGDEILRCCGLDRIINSDPYEAGNVLPCCGPCNVFRGDRVTVAEFRRIIKGLQVDRGQELVWK